MKLYLFRYYRFAIVFFVIITLIFVQSFQIIAAESTIPQNSQVEATISDGSINIVIKEENKADTITVNVMPNIADSFVGYNDVIPGLKKEGVLEIINETGEIYNVIDYNFTAEITNLKRIYNDAAEARFGHASQENFEKVIALSGDEWYQINAGYFGEENFNNVSILREIFGSGDITQGTALSGYETGQKMIDLGYHYLFQYCIQFSFNTNTDPVNNYDTKNIHILDYINKTDDNKVLVLDKFFADEIGYESLLMKIGYSMDNSNIGNAYNSAYADFGFELILKRVVKEDTETIEPEKPEPEPGIAIPNIVGKSNSSNKPSLLRDDKPPSLPESIPNEKVPVCVNPKTGKPHNSPSIALLYVISGIVILFHKKRQ